MHGVTTRRPTRRRTSTRTRTRTSSGYRPRRRRPRTATTLGGAAALALVALLGKMTWGVRIGLLVVVAVAAVAVLLWSKRGEIADQMAQDRAEQPPEAPPAPGAQA